MSEYLDDMKHVQKISKETVEQLREHLKITTSTLGEIISRVREELAHEKAYIENKLTEHDIKIKQQGRIVGNLTKGKKS